MGCNYKALLIVGIPAEKVIRTEYETTEVQKFDENTGTPYIKKNHRRFTTLFGKPVKDIQDSIEAMNLEYIHVSQNEYYIGLTISSVDSASLLGINTLTSKWLEVEQILLKQGYSGGVHVINAFYVSC